MNVRVSVLHNKPLGSCLTAERCRTEIKVIKNFLFYLVGFVLIRVQQSYDVEPENKQVRVLLRRLNVGYVTASGMQTDVKWDSCVEKQNC
jgi:hypothetical protein